MGILDRLETLLKSYITPEERLGGDAGFTTEAADPDLAAAYEELEDFLGDRERRPGNENARPKTADTHAQGHRNVPEALRPDFAELEVAFGAEEGVCRSAYKRLLKAHHPDRHAGDPVKMRQATEKTARLNTAFDRLEQWFRQRP